MPEFVKNRLNSQQFQWIRATDPLTFASFSGLQHDNLEPQYVTNFFPLTHNSIFSLDADERITPELAEEIMTLFRSGQPAIAAYEMPRKAFFGDKWVRHGGWYPDYVIRLFRKDRARFNERPVHEGVEVSGPVGRLHYFVEHYTYRSISDFIQRMDRYSTLSAEAYYKEGRRVGWVETVFRAWFTFVQMYILKRGFLDGGLGLQLAMLYACYTFVKYAKLKELSEKRCS